MELGILGLGSEYVTHIAGRVRDQMRLYGHNVHSLVGHVEFSLYLLCLYLLWVIFFSFYSWPHLQHVEVPRVGVKSELQLQAYTAATATQELSCICDLYHNLR